MKIDFFFSSNIRVNFILNFNANYKRIIYLKNVISLVEDQLAIYVNIS